MNNVIGRIGTNRGSDSQPRRTSKKVIKSPQIRQRDLSEHEAVIERGLATFIEVGRALMAIRDGDLYQDTHKTFAAYCRDRFDLKQSRAYQLIDSAVIVGELEDSTIVETLPKHEAHARPLVAVPKGKRAAVWKRALEISGQDADGAPKVIAAHVQREVNTFLNRSQRSQHRGRSKRVYTKVQLIVAGLLKETTQGVTMWRSSWLRAKIEELHKLLYARNQVREEDSRAAAITLAQKIDKMAQQSGSLISVVDLRQLSIELLEVLSSMSATTRRSTDETEA